MQSGSGRCLALLPSRLLHRHELNFSLPCWWLLTLEISTIAKAGLDMQVAQKRTWKTGLEKRELHLNSKQCWQAYQRKGNKTKKKLVMLICILDALLFEPSIFNYGGGKKRGNIMPVAKGKKGGWGRKGRETTPESHRRRHGTAGIWGSSWMKEKRKTKI